MFINHWWILLLYLSSAPLFANSEDLFEKAFGKKQELQNHQFFVQLIVDQSKKGETLLFIKGSEKFIESTPILTHLKELTFEESFQKIHSLEQDGQFNLLDLEKLGFLVQYDESMFTLALEAPPDFFKLRRHSVGQRSQIKSDVKEKDPDLFSAGLNFALIQPYSDTISSNGLNPLEVNFESFFNIHNIVFEGDFSFRDRQENPWKLTKKLVSFDLLSEMTRISFGDIHPQIRGFQSSISFGGITFSRNYQFDPSFRITPLGKQELFLDNNSIVEIFINGQRREKLNLSSGSHIIEHIPGYRGSNNVEIRITDSFNRIRSIHSNFIYDSNLLDMGLYRYSASFGFNSQNTDTSIEYLTEEPIWTAFYERGISKEMTLVGYTEGDKHLYQLGLQLTKSYLLGKLVLDTAFSHIRESDTANAISLSFLSYPQVFSIKEKPLNLNLSILTENRRFSRISNPNPNNLRKYSGLFSFDINPTPKSSLRFSSSLDFQRDSSVRPFQLSLQQNYFIKKNIDLSIGLTFERQSDGEYDRKAILLLNWIFSKKNTRIATSYDIHDRKKELSIKKHWKRENQNFDLELSPASSPDENDFFSSMNIQSDRFSSSLSYQFTSPKGEESLSTTHAARVSFTSALVYSGGHFAITRPVLESFLIVSKDKGIQKNDLYINPIGDHYLAKSKGILPAVVPNIRDYEKKELFIDIFNLPVGYHISENQWRLKPQHRSGFSIHLDSSARVLLQGYLIGNDGNALALKAGNLLSFDNNHKAIPFFTNRKGKFRALGLRSGVYSIELLDKNYKAKIYEIPKGKEGIHKAGRITIDSISAPVRE